jgi:hypothetical protein
VPPESAIRSSSARKRRTPATDSSAPTPVGRSPAPVALNATDPADPSGKRTSRQRSPPTVRYPSTTSVRPTSGCVGATTTTSAGNDARNSRSADGTSSARARTYAAI